MNRRCQSGRGFELQDCPKYKRINRGRKMLFRMILLVALVNFAALGQVIDSTSGSGLFPAIVDSVKTSIGLVQVHTDCDGISKYGTGFLILSGTLMATCSHTLFDSSLVSGRICRPDTSKIFVQFGIEQTWRKASVLVRRRDKDIALLRVDIGPDAYTRLGLRALSFAVQRQMKDGVDVACMGYDLLQSSERFGKRYRWISTHRAIISASFWVEMPNGVRLIDGFQIDALVNQGASGGPVFDPASGRVIGIVTSFQGAESNSIVVNYGLANCTPYPYIAALISDWLASQEKK